ncbi:MAG: hypothetical protein IKC09_00455 [Oscillospiraceae bacterium]|nr:hypothetical protein [Oscillospiraceae bacterium]
MSGKYDDLLYLPHPEPKNRARMSMLDRAAQFSPFAALTGYEEAIQETGRLTDRRLEPGETRKAELDRCFRALMERLGTGPWIRVTFFRPDPWKDGGAYVTENHRILKVDLYRRMLLAEDGSRISMDDIWELEILEENRT